MRLIFLGLAAQAHTATGHGKFFFDPKYACAVCLEVEAGMSCESFNACDMVSPSVVQTGCSSLCPSLTVETVPEGLELRVSKGFGTKSYDQVRISVISNSLQPPAPGFFDISMQFEHRWTQFFLHTAMKSIPPGSAVSYSLAGHQVNVWLPAQGAGVSGVLIADPCSGIGLMAGACEGARSHQTRTRIPELLNAFVPGATGTDFWGIFGDNWYDRDGQVTADVMNLISLETKSKIMATVPGNHDYWVMGAPEGASTQDQCGFGHMQYYAQDSKAAESALAGSPVSPFDFSVRPDASKGCNKAAINNFFWYNQIGNVGLIGQSGAYTLGEAQPFMAEACAWLSHVPGLQVAILFGHWDEGGLGATDQMAMPEWYTEMAGLPGCKELNDRQLLKYVMGHTHCNDPHPHGQVGAGFRVAGQGMGGCGNFGMPVVDTTGGRVRFWYFDTANDGLYNAVLSCVRQSGWRQCTHLATLWLDQPLDSSFVV